MLLRTSTITKIFDEIMMTSLRVSRLQLLCQKSWSWNLFCLVCRLCNELIRLFFLFGDLVYF